MADFDGTKPVSFAQARRGEVVVTQGYGKPPRVWRPCTTNPDNTDTSFVACHAPWKTSGTEAPENQPTIVQSEEVTYYIARIDIINDGQNIPLPPYVVVDSPTPPEGWGSKQAEAVSRIKEQKLSEIEVTEFGRHYTGQPEVRLSDNPDFDPAEDVNGGSGLKLRFKTYPVLNSALGGNDTNAKNSSWLYSVEIVDGGSGYTTGNSIDFTEEDEGYGLPPIIRIASDGRNGEINYEPFPIKSENGSIVDIKIPDRWDSTGGNGMYPYPSGSTYLPQYGYPEDFKASAMSGNNELTFKQQKVYVDPLLSIVLGEVQAIMRASFRGKYQCYYRYVNDKVPEEEGGPLYSNLSPLTEIDTGYGKGRITWTIDAPPDGFKAEIWRSSANQSTTLFQVASLDGTTATDGKITFIDDLNDHELTDAKREEQTQVDGTYRCCEFSAMPILLPNGELNANRFGVMDKDGDFSSAVMFQDRLWYSVDTSGKRPNSLMFSEADEVESCPDINEIVIQQNLRSADYMTALIPYAGALIACQSRHCHRLTYVSQPLIDVSTFLLAYRGCCSQRTWDIYEGIAYIMDDQGVYSLDPRGAVEPLTVGLDDLFQEKIDWSKRRWFIVRSDRRRNILRCSISFKGDNGDYPTRQLCYSLDYKAWWMEIYPTNLVGCTDCRSTTGNVESIWGGSGGGIYRLGSGLTDDAQGAITSVEITNPGRGYKKPPVITVAGATGSCADFICSINSDGEISGISIKQCGFGYEDGSLAISPPETGGQQATADYTVSSNATPVYYSLKTGNMEFITDTQEPKAAAAHSRQVSVVYQPTKLPSTLNLETYYNGALYPRSNVVTRDRGTGFVHSEDVPAATLDMKKTQAQDSESHGVARALFAGRTLDDMSGTDRHIAIGLSGKQDDSGRVTLHVVDIYGVNEAQ